MADSFFKKLYYRIPLFFQVSDARRSLSEVRTELATVRQELSALRVGFAQSMLEDLRQRCAASQGPKSLHLHEAQVCSQNGEDGILREIFHRLGPGTGTFVEIGVGDGRENNTAWLLSLGWRGYWIDGNDSFVAKLRERNLHASDALRWKVSRVDRENVDSLLQELGVPEEFDLLSIDVDQNTYHLWSAMQRFRPRVVVVEYNSTIPSASDWGVAYDATKSWDGTNNFGASLKAFERLGQRLGYNLVHCDMIGANAFFVRRDLVGDHFCPPFTAEHHYQPTRFGLFLRHGHPAAIMDRAESPS